MELNEFALQNYVSNISVRIYWPQQLPESDLYIVPLYNISTRTPADVQVSLKIEMLSRWEDGSGQGVRWWENRRWFPVTTPDPPSPLPHLLVTFPSRRKSLPYLFCNITPLFHLSGNCHLPPKPPPQIFLSRYIVDRT